MQEDGKEDHPSQPVRNNKTGSDGNAVKKSMDDQSHKHRVSPVTVDERILMSFLAKVEVRRNRMFEQVNQKISGENQDRGAFAAELQAGRENLYNRGRQHESRTQRHEVLEIRAVPILLDNDGAAKNIGRRCRETEQNAEENGMHVRGR